MSFSYQKFPFGCRYEKGSGIVNLRLAKYVKLKKARNKIYRTQGLLFGFSIRDNIGCAQTIIEWGRQMGGVTGGDLGGWLVPSLLK